jgi:asparagine synthase (glutamine-hydrolysing)
MQPKVELTTDEAIEEIDELVREAVRLRLRSDVPVGAFLSGGIDSGIITAMAAQAYPGRLITVTIGFEDEQFDERPLAKLVAEQYDTDHHEVLIRPDVARDLPKIAAAYDQPFSGASAVPSYYVAQAARRFVKVVLNGDGGDELFAGYRRYVAARTNRLLAWSDGPVCRPLWRALARVLPMPGKFRSGYAFAHRLVRGMAQDPVDRYLAWAVDELTEQDKLDLCGDGPDTPAEWLRQTQPSRRLARVYLDDLTACGPVDRMLGADFAGILPHDLLVKMDIACMAHSLEARSPLLDHVLAEHVARYPEKLKLPGFATKPLLRRLGSKYVPRPVQTAPKRGFEVPVVRWLRGELRPLCEDIMLSTSGLLTEMFDRRALERVIRADDGIDPGRWGRRMWLLLMLGIWDAHVRPG